MLYRLAAENQMANPRRPPDGRVSSPALVGPQ
jgi:hypothetical protein